MSICYFNKLNKQLERCAVNVINVMQSIMKTAKNTD